MCELLKMDEPRKRYAAMMSGLDVHYDLGAGHPLLGRRMPDPRPASPSVAYDGSSRCCTARGRCCSTSAIPTALDIAPWAERVRWVNARYPAAWELPVLGAVTAPSAVLIRPDGYVAWVGDGTDEGLRDALTTWFGPAHETAAR